MATYLGRWLPLVLLGALLPVLGAPASARPADVYHNPLAPRAPGEGTVDSCADPTVLRGREQHRRTWYMYCTTDPLNDTDTEPTASRSSTRCRCCAAAIW